MSTRVHRPGLGWLSLACLASLLVLASSAQASKRFNGFDLSDSSIPRGQIKQGGPPRDGIPAIDRPQFEAANAASWLTESDAVLGLSMNGQQRAYPIHILNWHELVNDELGEQGVLISYCPLCGTGMAFLSDVAEHRLQFGVSGLLYNSDVLFYDRQSESLWSQISTEAISGRWKGSRLTQLPLQHTSWGQWRRAHPETLVLSQNQGFSRDYRDDPYAGYEKSRRLFFRVNGRIGKDYHPKERVLGLVSSQQSLAIPFIELRRQGLARFNIDFAGESITIEWNGDANTAVAYKADGTTKVHTIAFWFAWSVFHPQTSVYKAP